jgi:hypothetical protein
MVLAMHPRHHIDHAPTSSGPTWYSPGGTRAAPAAAPRSRKVERSRRSPRYVITLRRRRCHSALVDKCAGEEAAERERAERERVTS